MVGIAFTVMCLVFGTTFLAIKIEWRQACRLFYLLDCGLWSREL